MSLTEINVYSLRYESYVHTTIAFLADTKSYPVRSEDYYNGSELEQVVHTSYIVPR